MTGVPVLPIGLWGTEAVWPRSSRVPDVTNLLHPPPVRVRVGKPVHLGLSDAVADTEAIMAAIMTLLPAEAQRPHEPTAEELARTFPPGHGDDVSGAARPERSLPRAGAPGRTGVDGGERGVAPAASRGRVGHRRPRGAAPRP